MHADCCFNLGGHAGCCTLIIAARQESWRGLLSLFTTYALSISTAPRKEPANSWGSVAENYSLHMPARKVAAAAAQWGRVCAKKTVALGGHACCMCVKAKYDVCMCMHACECNLFVFQLVWTKSLLLLICSTDAFRLQLRSPLAWMKIRYLRCALVFTLVPLYHISKKSISMVVLR